MDAFSARSENDGEGGDACNSNKPNVAGSRDASPAKPPYCLIIQGKMGSVGPGVSVVIGLNSKKRGHPPPIISFRVGWGGTTGQNIRR
jgi:hypothetical protein